VATVAEVFSLAIKHHQAGGVSEAERLYRQVVQADPSHADAWSCLGAACQAQGKLAEAETHYRRALQLAPDHASTHNCLGVLMAQQSQLAEAVANFQKALRFAPESAEIHNNLGLAFAHQGLTAEAVNSYQQALRLKPDYAQAFCNLGLALYAQGQHDEAILQFEQAVRCKPDYPEALNGLGSALTAQGKLSEAAARCREALRLRPRYAEAHNNLGNVLVLQDKLEEAATHCQEALRLRPDFPEAHNNLGNALLLQGKLEEAVTQCQKALRLRPDFPEALNNLGNALERQDKLDEAIHCYHQALQLRPDMPEVHNNLGNALLSQGKLEEAVTAYQEAMRLKPQFAKTCANLGSARKYQGRFDEALTYYKQALAYDAGHAETHFNLGLLHLLLGNWAEGWPEYDWRWQTTGFRRFSSRQPRWDGSPLAGRTLLVLAEQGLGDTLQFIRYVRLVQEPSSRVIVRCPPALRHILAECLGAEHLVMEGSPLPAFDVYAPLLRLPGILGTTPKSVPADIPYLLTSSMSKRSRKSEVEGRKSNEALLTSDVGHPTFDFRHPTSDLLVGIAWQGNPRFTGDRQRSIPLGQFAPLANVEGVQLISLQKGPGTEQLRGQTWVRPLLTELDEASGAFMDTAAVMKHVDLVISSDSAVAHLAGALGVPVWVALPVVPDWRWLLERQDSPWYPTMRLFRQTRYGQWEDVFERLAEELKAVVSCQLSDHEHQPEAQARTA